MCKQIIQRLQKLMYLHLLTGKSLALAELIYVSMCLNVPDSVKQIDQRIFRNLWGKGNRIKRKSIINKSEDGGLHMVDFDHKIVQ